MKIKVENIRESIAKLLQQEDTDGDKKISILDNGPKFFMVKTIEDKDYEIKSTYYLSNLLQELFLELEQGKDSTEIPIEKIEELPADRISRLIKDYYWNGLTRTIDREGIHHLINDSKNQSLIKDDLIIYVPASDENALEYYKGLESELPVKTIQLPKEISPEFVRSINHQPGVLALDLEQTNSGYKGKPFVVPGARFNEMYGWDSYFEGIGLIIDGKIDLAKNMAEHFQYEIEHYGKILNANRSYYLTRTQPPFYSSFVKEIYVVTQDKAWLKHQLESVINEYENVWIQPPRLSEIGLNRYFAEGIGMPPEPEEGHYDAVFRPFAEKENLTIEEYQSRFNSGEIINDELNEYFKHDRTVRESGHDTSYRLEGKAADLALVELNAMLYKYESDLAELIENEFNGTIQIDYKTYSADNFKKLAKARRSKVNRYLWNEEQGFYFDYNLKEKQQEDFVSATGVFPLWANLADEKQAQKVVQKLMSELKEKGGVVSGMEKSRGEISEDRPAKQWDYPYGWAPHQMIIWRGLQNYGYHKEMQELIYRWLYMITKNGVDFSGTIPEKYDVVQATHLVFVEYGNVGTDFEYITKEGFGWMNASFQLGMKLLDENLKNELNQLTSPENLFK